MVVPFVCAACRAQRLPSNGLRTVRRLTQSVSQRQNGYTRRGGHEQPSTFVSSENGRDKSTHAHSQNGSASGRGRTVGRYSGKELRPEELLSQLNLRGRPRPAGKDASTTSKTAKPQDHGHKTTREQRPRAARTSLPVEVQTRAQLFTDCVNLGDDARAWTVLRALVQDCSQLSQAQIDSLVANRSGLQRPFRQFLWTSAQRWLDALRAGNPDDQIPSPLQVLQLLQSTCYGGSGQWRPSVYRPVLWQVAEGLCDLRFSEIPPHGAVSQAIEGGIGDLVRMWKICITMQLAHHPLHASYGSSDEPSEHVAHSRTSKAARQDTDWSFLPLPSVFTKQSLCERPNATFEELLGTLVPVNERSVRLASDACVAAALMTLDLLRSGVSGDGKPLAEVEDNAPFALLLEAMLNHTPTPRLPAKLQAKLISAADSRVVEQYRSMAVRLRLDLDGLAQLPAKPPTAASVEESDDLTQESEKTLAAEVAIDDAQDTEATKEHDGRTPEERFAQLNIIRLGRVLERQDARQAQNILREVLAYAQADSSTTKALPLELYEHLMLTFLSLRNIKTAVEIWDHIMRAGYEPTVKTYTVMMRGAQASRDLSGMEAFWKKLHTASLTPDEHAWSVRIFGLLKMKAVKQGLLALNEMGQRWFAAARAKHLRELPASQKKHAQVDNTLASHLLEKYPSHVDGVPRPNLIVMNSAISALAQSNDKDIVKVLTWGRSFGVEPDINTYNALLNVAMRRDQVEEAMSILRSMQQRGVEANSTTWTVLLTALFQNGFLDGVEPAEQQQKIFDFIESLEGGGNGMPSIDSKGYALVIDRLLKHYNNSAAATAVMNHMIGKGIQPTAHIYTIIMASYFQQEPTPDFAAIQALWNQMESQDGGYGVKVDSIFYDRMIEGYALHHHAVGMQPCLDFLRRARQRGQKPGWGALQLTAQMLADRGEWNRLRALVNEMRVGLRDSRGGLLHRGQKDFWHFILKTGILRDEGITRLEQILSEERRESPLLAAGIS